MKKMLLALILVLSFITLLLSACTGLNIVVGSGNIISKQYDFKYFNAVEATSSIDVRITPADTYSVTVSTHENIFDHLTVEQSGKTLKIHLPWGSFSNTDIKAVITMPQLVKLDLSGASKGNVQDFKSTNDLELQVSGASQLNLINMEAANTTGEISGASKVSGQLNSQKVQLKVSGASRCELTGAATNVTLDVSGASQAVAKDFQTQNADVSVSGASKATINASGTLSVDATGASTLEYFGNPNLKQVNVSGSSRLNHQ